MVTNQMNELPKTDVDAYDIELALWIEGDIRNHTHKLSEEYDEHSYDERAEFLADKVDKFKDSKWDDINEGINECIINYVLDNHDKWIRELKGDNLYKVKVVLELDVESADKLDTVVSNVKELFYDKSIGDYGCDAIKNVRVVNAVGKEVDE